MTHTTLVLITAVYLLFLQTLTTLELFMSQIGNQGVEHLADALQQNKVIRVVPLYFQFQHLFPVFLRH
jgi:hypothetical protein